jgi:phenylacetic acid degradation operon negative regulatory protein
MPRTAGVSRRDRRDHAVGAPSARGYLVTLLGEFVLPNGGQVWTAPLIEGLGALGVGEKTARQAIARSAEHGLLTPEKVGRRTRWYLTPHARAVLTEGTKRIYSLHHEPAPWDGRWLLVFTSVPESRRELRYRLRTRMGWAGLAALAPGAWVSPWVDREPEVKEVLADLGLDGEARSFVGGLGGLGDVGDIVAQAWDLQRIGGEYDAFIARYRSRRPSSERQAFVATAQLVDDWRRFPYLEPDLPSELLPRAWSGHRAAGLFHRLHDRWRPDALAWWRRRAAE